MSPTLTKDTADGLNAGSATVARKQRNNRMDAIKGGAILLVILGLAIQSHLTGFDDNLLFRIIYSFHMSLFMILSGWFAMPEKYWKLKAAAVRLVLPVFSWYLILYVVEGQYKTMPFVELVRRWVVSPDVGLWFLWVLFLCHVWLVLARQLEVRIGVSAYLVGVVVLCAIPFSSFGLTLAKYYFPFFALGYLTARYWKDIARYSHVAFAVSILVFPLAFHFWHRTSAGLLPLQVLLAGHPVNAAIPIMLAARLVCAVSGSVMFAYLLAILAALRPVGALLAWLGVQTLEIYVIHQPLIHYAIGQGGIAVVTSMIATTAASLGAIWVLRKSEWASLLLFGRIPRGWGRRAPQQSPDSAVAPMSQTE
jgi:fucose 4-O-acetylase-like acetyltransferase